MNSDDRMPRQMPEAPLPNQITWANHIYECERKHIFPILCASRRLNKHVHVIDAA